MAEPQKNEGRSSEQETAKVIAALSTADVLAKLKTAVAGITEDEASRKLIVFGTNEIAARKPRSWVVKLLQNLKDPLSALLFGLAIIAYLTKDLKTTVIIIVMLLLSVGLRFVQELRADHAAEKLKKMVRTTATVRRASKESEIPLETIVPGDIIILTAGDLIPADLRLLESRDLFVNQSTLTGESLPVEKHASPVIELSGSDFDLTNICFMGTSVQSGTATASVFATGKATRFGALAVSVEKKQETSNFDIGVTRFTWLMLRFIGIMVPLVFLVNGIGKGDWVQAFLFALAVAVGLTPELLPMIVTVNLSTGALAMSKRKVIVKRLNAIQNLGAMDVLCTDKTGTLTEGKVSLIRHMDPEGKESPSVLALSYLNSLYQSGFQNLLDNAVLAFSVPNPDQLKHDHEKVDEIPFDFKRRRVSTVVTEKDHTHTLICKGAVDEVLACSKTILIHGEKVPLEAAHQTATNTLVDGLSGDGFRVVAVATRSFSSERNRYTFADEQDLTVVGFLAFLDPPKESAKEALTVLHRDSVTVKILTGDNERVTRKVCKEVGLDIVGELSGGDLAAMAEAELEQRVEKTNVFFKLEPEHKLRIIAALRKQGHTVGYLGDGINDAPALRGADVGVSVDDAVDIAKETSDIILLEKSMLVLHVGVREGRRVFGNITNYIRMAASSNFGNMFSVLGASLFLPFLPMLPLQVIVNNLLYDVSQTAIPTDRVDEEYLRAPRPWSLKRIEKFILWVGPVSSVFDFLTFGLLLAVFGALSKPEFFHTGWFVESLVSQTLIIHIIRTRKVPFLQSRASLPLILTTLVITLIAIWLPFSSLAATLGFVPLPPLYWVLLFVMMVAYFGLAQVVKGWYAKRYGWD